MGIEKALQDIREKIRVSAHNAGRRPEDIRIIAVSKNVSPARVIQAINAGAFIFGENKVQEAREKISHITPDILDSGVEWHLIGHLQKNKAKTAAQLFALVHTLDSRELAEVLNNSCRKLNKKQRVLIQVKLSDELSKHGIDEEAVPELIEHVIAMDSLELQGLMTMPPYFRDAEKARPYFRRLRKIAETARKKGFALPELSMGMSNDFDVAIEEGATMVRIGTAIFGERHH